VKTNKSVKIILIVLASIIALVFISVKVIDFGFKQPCPPPDKPKGIPTEAIWNGGCDGGYWINLVGIKDDKYRIKIYLDYKAEVLMDADFVSDGKCLLPLDSSVLKLISVVDIDKITLKTDKNKTCF